MLNIENYDQWARVVDDDELILEMYNSGIRQGTDEFRELVGEYHQGKPASSKEYAVLAGGIGITVLSIWGSVKLIKLAGRKTKQFVSNKIFKGKDK